LGLPLLAILYQVGKRARCNREVKVSLKAFIAAAGAVLALAGLIVGFSYEPSVSGGGDTVVCGAAFSDSNVSDAAARQKDQLNQLVGEQTDLGDQCEQKRSTFSVIAGFLIGIGVLALLGGLLVRGSPRATPGV
jgi:hypothetical protein